MWRQCKLCSTPCGSFKTDFTAPERCEWLSHLSVKAVCVCVCLSHVLRLSVWVSQSDKHTRSAVPMVTSHLKPHPYPAPRRPQLCVQSTPFLCYSFSSLRRVFFRIHSHLINPSFHLLVSTLTPLAPTQTVDICLSAWPRYFKLPLLKPSTIF